MSFKAAELLALVTADADQLALDNTERSRASRGNDMLEIGRRQRIKQVAVCFRLKAQTRATEIITDDRSSAAVAPPRETRKTVI